MYRCRHGHGRVGIVRPVSGGDEAAAVIGVEIHVDSERDLIMRPLST